MSAVKCPPLGADELFTGSPDSPGPSGDPKCRQAKSVEETALKNLPWCESPSYSGSRSLGTERAVTVVDGTASSAGKVVPLDQRLVGEVAQTAATQSIARLYAFKVANFGIFLIRCFLTLIAIVGLLVNIIIAFPITAIFNLIKTIVYIIQGKSKEEIQELWKSWLTGTASMIKNAVEQSFKAALDIKNGKTKISEWGPELLCLMIDTNGELRNALSVANIAGAMNSHLLGLTLGPFRIFQGLLVVTLSTIKIVETLNKLNNPALNPIERNELELLLKSYEAYLAVGALWIAMGTLQIIIALGVVSNPWIALAMSIITLLLFDVGFLAMSSFYIRQSMYAIENYISPIEKLLQGEYPDTKEGTEITGKMIIDTAIRKMLSEELQAEIPEDIKLGTRRFRTDEELERIQKELEELEKKDTLLSMANAKLLQEVIKEQQLKAKIQEELARQRASHGFLNIGLNALLQINITVAGTPWDIASVAGGAAPFISGDSVSVPDSPLCDLTQAVLWILQNTLCKWLDISKMGEALTGAGCDSPEKSKKVRSATKVYICVLLTMFSAALIATTVTGAPNLFGHSSLFDM